jgi:hypothetical protein
MARKKFLNKKVLMSIFIVSIMVLSAFGFMMSYRTKQGGATEEYNGIPLMQTPKGLMLEVNDNPVYFKYHPKDLEVINMTDDIKSIFVNTEALILTYDPDSEFAPAMGEIQFDMEQQLLDTEKVYLARGLTNATGYAVPSFSCSNATDAMPVLYLKKGEKSELTLDNNCITLTASTEPELEMFYTRILYTIFGVMR